MAGQATVWALFGEPDRLADAARQLRAAGHPLDAYTPVMTHSIAEALAGGRPSKVRWFATVGAIVGGAGGMGLSIWTALVWENILGGKPIISIPPFIVIAFECLILFGAGATVLGFLILARLPTRKRNPNYEACLSEDRFALEVTCSELDRPAVERILQEAGAESVRAGAGINSGDEEPGGEDE